MSQLKVNTIRHTSSSSDNITLGADGSVTLPDDTITLAKMAGGTDGVIITYDASGNPVHVGPGSDGQVLTSTGAGSPPAFESLPASGGLTAFDSWRVNSNISNSATPITANWERDDSTNGFHATNQMSESSGTFTFPTTGIWYIYFGAYGYSSSDNDNIQTKITYTADNGTYYDAARSYSSMNNDDGGNLYMHSNVSTMFDVSNTTNCKIRFHILNVSSMTHECSSSANQVYAHFMKLGDT
tara:strand:- start:266 stop:988 length:723 start_codon:yes stop_codon:yes gene_type:complete